MNFKKLSESQIQAFDKEFAYLEDDLGVVYFQDYIQIKLWQPLAKNVEILLFSNYQASDYQTLEMIKEGPIWKILLNKKYQHFYYQFQITHKNNQVTIALDPYAKSMAPFNHFQEKVGKGFIFNWQDEIKKPSPLKAKINSVNEAIIYELQIRDYTSLYPNALQNTKGTFNAALEVGIFDHLNQLNFTHLQLLPIQNTYTVNEFNQSIINQGEGSGFSTNYNWGYDPHNYFSINGIFSSDPLNPKVRINEFAHFVNQAHQKRIGIILDVVFNHLFNNDILNNILPGYYFRENAKVKPVDQPPLATQRVMTRKLIIDVLKYFVEYFDIDGFRFDLSCFFDKKTHEEISEELRKIKPNIILHGEAWPYSDLEFNSTYIKGYKTNNFEFGYFNDTMRNAITCYENDKSIKGLIFEKSKDQFDKYISSVVGNIKEYHWKDIPHSEHFYDLFNDDTTTNLVYLACHDGLTLWDKIAVHAKDKSFEELLQMYRKSLIMLYATLGRKLLLAGTEFLQSKPCDISGADANKCEKMSIKDYLNLNPDKNSVHENSYKTTDYVNGLKWNNLNIKGVKENIYDFVSNLNKFKLKYSHFNLISAEEINQKLSFIKANYEDGLLIYKVADNNIEITVMHNFSDNIYTFEEYIQHTTLFSSLIIQDQKANVLQAHESKILIK
ncbi:alpha-amylase [Mycoplasmopsis citelli]|uniref:alpha-amylase family glycosyl hydrolase n=1 Tax=Mycoplasmopsis citelli TaxID=171281 RepID=UPI0021143988|nr:alpha-amylase [Mycoplasmopsis citelli]UUD36349.1 alpha-amylase [Mycoplasmopsis citelli]